MDAIFYTVTGVIDYLQRNPVLTSIIAALSASLMGIIVWVNQTKRNANKQAGMNIVAAFQPELDALLQTDVDSGVILSDNAYRKHESAINNNIRHLHWHQKIRLKKSWEALTCHKLDNEKKMFSYLMYSDCGSLDKRRRMRPLAIERIKEIISIVS